MQAFYTIEDKLQQIHSLAVSLRTYIDFSYELDKQVVKYVIQHIDNVISVLKSFREALNQRLTSQPKLGDYIA